MSFLRPEVFELRGEPLGLVFGDGRPEDTEVLCISPCRPAPSVSSGRAQAPFVSFEGALPAAVLKTKIGRSRRFEHSRRILKILTGLG